ncbi:hypothetical protein BU26DRAFT_220847 [Trematosphaeria pertusa]|uniref:Uncharacterized protein n=1 Tax=Trematosphaeria pertusa TaxID=390896 RepID=A0A6A6IVU7_9PLEO|nr:uncharacterized protein BU26DRAFT_220847 [Trematosphaeria pertusa]KAF2253323.1 hypothetical protein BU26DRAFT_220847 [Trematosphaeria pertusa]
MSIARAVTKRIKRPDAPNASSTLSPPARSQSVKSPGLQIDRSKISSPVALISTTNMLSYNAPDIATLRKTSSSTASTHSADDSDHSISTRSRASSHASRETLTDASSVNSSPTSPAPNHLSGYFASANKTARKSASAGNLRKSASSSNLQQLKEDVEEAVPAIPERALSHSKRAHERLAQKRSLQSMSRHSSVHSTHSHSSRMSREHRTSLDMFKATIQEETHPFGKELEQLNEVAEEFGGAVRDAEMEADLAIIRERCLAMFCAADYLAEIQPLFANRFGTVQAPAPLAWI